MVSVRPIGRSRRAGILLALGFGLLAAGANGPPRPKSPEAIATGVAARIGVLREEAGVPGLERRPALDEAAAERAREVAELPDGRQLGLRVSVEDLLKRRGLRRPRSAEARVAVLAGFPDLAGEVASRWRDTRDSRLVDRKWSAIGVGAAAGRDGEIVVVALFVEDASPLPDPRLLEERTEQAVNTERERRGLAPLRPSEALRAVARAHSADMRDRGYFDHRSPDGAYPADRIRGAGLPFTKISENIARSFGVDDPVRAAVDGWLESPGHLGNLLDADVVETGVGVAADEEEGVYFTQIFLAPGE